MQNTSHAVMAQRVESRDSLDDFPTPPWATRALIEHILPNHARAQTCWEPACNRGYMARVLNEYFDSVVATDIHDYGYGSTADYLTTRPSQSIDWVITNPPFRLAESFALKALNETQAGVALLVRTSWIESVSRYHSIFKPHPPAIVAQFTERVPMVKGRLDKTVSTATSYCWIVWLHKDPPTTTQLVWIPPSRKAFERHDDYSG